MSVVILSNTLTGKKEEFKPLKPGMVKLYVCGITPYEVAHIGHGRCYISFDLLYRLLKFLGYDVNYCRNITDIDDKILNKAQQLFGDISRYADVTAPVIKRFNADMKALGCLPPDYEPRVTENIDVIIDFIEKLIIAGKAYKANGDVYFSIKTFPEYGKLSKHKLKDLRAGARVEPTEKKKDPLDFALWKAGPEGMFWKSPWGWGRPGWHIECSALANKYLGKQLDIHGGGQDLIFPHHENEIAQSEGLFGVPMARYWVHNGFVRVDKEKMSKSIGNIINLQDIFKQYDPMVLRYYFITHHYRAPIDFSYHDLQAAQKSYQRLCKLFDIKCTDKELDIRPGQSSIVDEMLSFLADDLNTPGMLGVLFANIDTIKEDHTEMCAVKGFLQRVVGLTLKQLPEKAVEITPEIEALIKEREEARKAKDWARADAIRDKLRALGIEVKDERLKNGYQLFLYPSLFQAFFC
ncbi:cysteine--tRNA ligase [Candidatus Dependentiae bacterium]|nr:MAG: cysteine--tRNA ligase [Candidatus Dependentiae bacterium]